jgi:hypothetical protein
LANWCGTYIKAKLQIHLLIGCEQTQEDRLRKTKRDELGINRVWEKEIYG